MFIKRDGKDDCIIAGVVIADAKEKEYNGETFYEFGIGMGKDKDGNNLPIVNITVWNRQVDIKKGDRVAACGKLKQTQKDDKTYYSMSADFVSKETSAKKPTPPPQPELTEVDDDDLPF